MYVVAQLFRNAFVNAHVVSTIKKERQLQAARMMCSGLQLLCIVDRKRALNERVRNEIGPKVRGRWNQDLSIARGSLPRKWYLLPTLFQTQILQAGEVHAKRRYATIRSKHLPTATTTVCPCSSTQVLMFQRSGVIVTR